MPARDRFHQAVRHALEKAGWIVTADPLYIQYGGVDLYIDLAAELLIAAEKDGHRIAVEIKSFIAPSVLSEFHTALGQFISYRTALQVEEPDRVLYLAVPADTYQTFFALDFTKTVIASQQLKVIVYDVVQEEITAWHD